MTVDFRWFEIWSEAACAGGVKLTPMRDMRDVTIGEKVDGSDMVTFSVPVGIPGTQHLIEGNVVRSRHHTPASDQEYAIIMISPSFNANSNLIRVTCIPYIIWKLRSLSEVRTYTNGVVSYTGTLPQTTVSAALAFLISFLTTEHGISFISAGTLFSAASLFDLPYANAKPIKFLLDLTQHAAVQCEWRWVRTLDTGFEIDIERQVNIGAAIPLVRSSFNLRAQVTQSNATEMANVLRPAGKEYGDGKRFGLEEMTFKIAAITGAGPFTLEMEENCIPYNDTYKDYFLVKQASTFSSVQIVNTIAPNFIVLSASTGFSVGHMCTLRETAGETGREPTIIYRPPSIITHKYIEQKYELPTVPWYRNWLGNLNPQMDLWNIGETAALNWTALFGSGTGTLAVSKNTDTDFILYGQYSMKLALTNPSHFLGGVGTVSDTWFVHRRTGKSRFVVIANFFIDGAPLSSTDFIRMNLNGADTINGHVSKVESANGIGPGLHTLILEGDAIQYNRNDYTARIFVAADGTAGNLGGSTQIYVDSFMVALVDLDGEEVEYTPNSHCNIIRDAAILKLESHGVPLVQQDISFVDLGDDIASTKITTGGNLRLQNPERATDELVRVMAFNKDPHDISRCSITVATLGQTFTQRVARL